MPVKSRLVKSDMNSFDRIQIGDNL